MTAATSRLLALLSLLQTRRDWPGSTLAQRLDISARTVRRDIDRLREMGYAIHATMGPTGGYRLDAGSELPPLLFDDDQAVALAVALQAAAETGVGIEEAAIRALTTVRQVLPTRLRHRLDVLDFTAIPAGNGPRDDDPVPPMCWWRSPRRSVCARHSASTTRTPTAPAPASRHRRDVCSRTTW